jgi:NAD-dependent DNA ligase
MVFSPCRSETERLVGDRGGRAASSAGRQTGYGVARRNHGSKLDDTRSSAAKVIDEAAFRKMVGES